MPGSCTRTRCTRFPSSGDTASTIAMVPFSYKSTFFTRPMSKYSRKREYDIREDATLVASSALAAEAASSGAAPSVSPETNLCQVRA